MDRRFTSFQFLAQSPAGDQHVENFENGGIPDGFNVVQLLNSASALGSGDRRHGIAKARQQPSRREQGRHPHDDTWQTLKMGRAPPGALLSKFCHRHIVGGDPTPTAKSGIPPRRVTPESAVGARPRGRRANPRREGGGRHRTLHVVSCFLVIAVLAPAAVPYCLFRNSVAVLARSRSHSRAERCS